jgi:hypothetical protein
MVKVMLRPFSADGQYSASSTYRAFFYGSTKLLGAKELWQVKAPSRIKIFFWLAPVVDCGPA